MFARKFIWVVDMMAYASLVASNGGARTRQQVLRPSHLKTHKICKFLAPSAVAVQHARLLGAPRVSEVKGRSPRGSHWAPMRADAAVR